MSSRKYFFIAGIVVVVSAIFFPVQVLRVQNTPKEDPKYIRRIYDTHTVGQVFIHPYYSINAIEVLLRTDTPHTAALIAHDEHGNEIAHVPIALTTEDQWATLSLNKPLPKGTDTITFSTTSGTASTQALLMRFQSESDRYDQGNMVVDGSASYGDIAFRVTERLPVWHALLVWGQLNDTSVYATLRTISIGIALAAAIYAMIAIRFPILVIFIAVILIYAPYATAINGVFGGDAFNYLFKTYALLHGHDPFAADPRKGPFFSFLLIPAFFLSNPLVWSRWVGIMAAAATAALVPLVAKKMEIPWPIAVMAGVLTVGNSFLIFEASDALAVTTFTCLMLFSVYAYLSFKKSQKWIWILAVSSALTMLTRFEGALVSAILLPAAWMRYRISWKKIIWPIIVAILIMAIPLSSFLFSGKSGIRTPQDISNDDGLFLVHSFQDKQLGLNIQRSYEFFTNVWVQKGAVMQIATWFALGIVIGVCIMLLKQFLSKIAPRLLAGIGIVASLGFLFLLAMNNEINRVILVAALYILTGIGIALFIRKKPIDGIAILTMLLAETMIVIWILPKDRYFLFMVPFLYLFLVYGIHILTPSKKKIAQIFAVCMMCIAAVFFFQDAKHYLPKTVEAYNNNAQETDVLLKALIALRASNTHVGLLDDEGLAATIYISQQNLFIFNQVDNQNNADQELQFIRDHHIRYLMERDRAPQWQAVRAHSELFSAPKIYTTKNGDSKVYVYQVK